MRIALVAPLLESVPPRGYGGTELVVALLSDGLVARGHEVTLFASGDSLTGARLISVCDNSLRTSNEIAVSRWQAYDLRLLLKLEEMMDEFDLVHNHMGYQALPFLENMHPAVLTTNHNPIKPYNTEIYRSFKHLPFVSISQSYRSLNLAEELNYVGVVYNGIKVNQFISDIEKRDYLLFVGRVSRDKGTEIAVDIASRLGLPLKIVGKIDTADEEFFKNEVLPRIKRYPAAEYLGEATEAEKIDLYSRAVATLYPVAFDEPFGLVMVESLASGTPVMALRRGSVLEIVTDGITGIVAQTADELVDRFPEVLRLSRHDCRMRVLQMYSSEKMVESYESVYRKLLGKKTDKRSPSARKVARSHH